MLANLPSDRDWNNEGLVAGDRCYHSSARLGGVRLSLPVTWGPLTGLENSVWLCVWLCVCDSVCVPLNGCGAKYKRWNEWLCFHAKPHSVHSKCRYQHVDKKREACTGWLTGRAMERVHGSMTRGLSSPATTHCDEDRSCQWIHGAGISSQNLRKPTEATADPQLLELNLRHWGVNVPRVQSWRGKGGYRCREQGKGVNFGSGVCQNLLQPRWCTSAGDCSRQVKLWTWLPFPQCVGTF